MFTSKKMNIRFLAMGVFSLLLISCNNNDDLNNNCEYRATINFDQYWNGQTNLVDINRMTINENCLTINFTAFECEETPFTVHLIDSGEILNNNPKERNLKLLFDPEVPGTCLETTIKEVTFDISQLQIGGNEVLLNIKLDPNNFFHFRQILYEY